MIFAFTTVAIIFYKTTFRASWGNIIVSSKRVPARCRNYGDIFRNNMFGRGHKGVHFKVVIIIAKFAVVTLNIAYLTIGVAPRKIDKRVAIFVLFIAHKEYGRFAVIIIKLIKVSATIAIVVSHIAVVNASWLVCINKS